VVPERHHQRRLWRAQAGPGAILAAGEIVGTWRHRMVSGRLHVTLHPFHKLAAKEMDDLAREAEEIAALRDANDVAMTVGAD
jgi:hypothetical protein